MYVAILLVCIALIKHDYDKLEFVSLYLRKYGICKKFLTTSKYFLLPVSTFRGVHLFELFLLRD